MSVGRVYLLVQAGCTVSKWLSANKREDAPSLRQQWKEGGKGRGVRGALFSARKSSCADR